MRSRREAFLTAILLFGCGNSCDGDVLDLADDLGTSTNDAPQSRAPIQPLEGADREDPQLVELGNLLYNDVRLSKDGTVACASCHVIPDGGDDGRARSTGVDGQQGAVNAPTVINSGLNFAQFWDGRASTLEEQIEGPVQNELEMGASWNEVVASLNADGDYVRRFGRHFDDGVTRENIKAAVAAFERALVAVGSPFDRWLKGDESALKPEEVEGFELFKSVGCIACHQGRNVGGNMFQRFGVIGDYFKERGHINDADYGRYNVTQKDEDRFFFRVPSLRMVEHTAPYFHDGSAKTLEDAVRVMARYQLGRQLEDAQIESIVMFLRTLDGPIPEVIEAKAGPLPEAGRGTP